MLSTSGKGKVLNEYSVTSAREHTMTLTVHAGQQVARADGTVVVLQLAPAAFLNSGLPLYCGSSHMLHTKSSR